VKWRNKVIYNFKEVEIIIKKDGYSGIKNLVSL
jgi:hypothetical protein